MKSDQSLQSKLHQLLPQGNSTPDNEARTVKTSLLKIINNTVVFGNSVYQIRNICTVELADLTQEHLINQTVPREYWFLLALGVVLISFYGLGILLLIFVAWLFWKHSKLEKSQKVERYGLRIGMNSGEGVILTSSSKDFVLKIIVTLYGIINTEESKAVAFNFETLSVSVEDKSIKIGQANGSAVVSGKVTGDVVNIV